MDNLNLLYVFCMSAKANTRLNERGMVSDGGKESGFAAYVHIWKKNVKKAQTESSCEEIAQKH